MDIKDVEQKIKNYYRGVRETEKLEYRAEALRIRERELQRKLDNSKICFEARISAINYDGVCVQTSGITSPQERALEKAYAKVEKDIEDVRVLILEAENDISRIKAENSEMEFILRGLKEEYKIIAEAIYKDGRTALEMSLILNMDKSTVCRKKEKVLKETQKWLNFWIV